MEIISDEASKASTIKEQDDTINYIDYTIIKAEPILKNEFPTEESLEGLKDNIK